MQQRSNANLFEPVYLGDGLYAAFDGWQIELYASDGIQKTNQVYLEPAVLVAFERYVKNLQEEIENVHSK
jgi:hypothetical protein